MARSSGMSRSQARVRQARTGLSYASEQEEKGHKELVDWEGQQEADGVADTGVLGAAGRGVA